MRPSLYDLIQRGNIVWQMIQEYPPDSGQMIHQVRLDGPWEGHPNYTGPRKDTRCWWVLPIESEGWDEIRLQQTPAEPYLS